MCTLNVFVFLGIDVAYGARVCVCVSTNGMRRKTLVKATHFIRTINRGQLHTDENILPKLNDYHLESKAVCSLRMYRTSFINGFP